MKRKIIASLTLSILILTLALSGCIFDMRKHVLDESDSFGISDISEIDVDVAVKVLDVVTSESDSVKITLIGTIWSSFDPSLIVEKNGEKITVRTHEPSLFNTQIGKNDLEMLISVPRDYSEDLFLKTVAGSITVKNLEIEDFKASSVSGLLDLSTVLCENAKISTVSGDIAAQDIKCDDMTIETVSGDIGSEGNISELDIKGVSGKITVSAIGTLGDIQIDNVSGDVVLSLCEDSGFTLNFTTVTGDFSSSEDLSSKSIEGKNVKAVCKDGSKTIKVSTVSGDLDIG